MCYRYEGRKIIYHDIIISSRYIICLGIMLFIYVLLRKSVNKRDHLFRH